jgi:chromosome partitioning protein
MVIAVVNSKGGVGKSTLAGNLVAWLHELGHKVVLADCDSQNSSSEWITDAVSQIRVARYGNADEVLEGLPQLKKESDFVVCDGPGSQTETSRALLMWADLAVIPCKASMFEARALAKNTAFVRQAQAIRKGAPHAVAVLSMVGKDFRLTKDMRDAAATLKLPLAATHVTLRQAYADAPGQSTLVWKMGSREKEAAKEIDILFRELLPEACSDRVVGISRAKESRRASGSPGDSLTKTRLAANSKR